MVVVGLVDVGKGFFVVVVEVEVGKPALVDNLSEMALDVLLVTPSEIVDLLNTNRAFYKTFSRCVAASRYS